MKSTISARNPGSFYWRIIFRVQDLVPGCVHCYCGVTAMEINEAHPNEKKQRLLIHSLLEQWSQPPHLNLTETQRQAEEKESFLVEGREGFRYALMERYSHGEAIGR